MISLVEIWNGTAKRRGLDGGRKRRHSYS